MQGVTYRIPVMENPNCRPAGGQLFGEFRALCPESGLAEERLMIPLWGVPSGVREGPAQPAETSGLWPKGPKPTLLSS